MNLEERLVKVWELFHGERMGFDSVEDLRLGCGGNWEMKGFWMGWGVNLEGGRSGGR
ncbi:MAG: hypothetical protein HC904_13955 [Blastochloris sp.]|nr:hypothetical protein [Blastochloris sp.]